MKCPRLRPARRASHPQTQQKYQRFQHFGIAQPVRGHVFLFGIPKSLYHLFQFPHDGLVFQVRRALFVDKAGIDQRLVLFGERNQSRDQIAVRQAAVGTGAFGHRETKSQQQVFAFVKKLLVDLDFGKQLCRVESSRVTMSLMFPRLLQIGAIAGAVQRYFPLLPATLGANLSVDGRTKSLFLPDIADRATHGPIISCSLLPCPLDSCFVWARCDNGIEWLALSYLKPGCRSR